jgi:ABC-type nitrate/sulfonate/bicarbonate transport system permease component
MTTEVATALDERQVRRKAAVNFFFARGGVVLGVLLWEGTARALDYAFFPPLSRVFARLIELTVTGQIVGNLASSLQNFAIGFAICIVVGVPVGLLMGVYPRVRHALDVYVNALLTAPTLILAPIFFTLFGLSRWAIISIIVSYGLFIIIISAEGAVSSVDPALLEMARCYGAGDRQIMTSIVTPASLPLVFAGIRIGAGRCVKGMVNGEMFIAVVGLGAIIINAGRTFDATSVLAVLVLTIMVALVISAAIRLVDRKLTGWLPETSRSGGM